MNRREAIQKTALVLGYAVSAPVIAGIMDGCKAKPALSYTPVFFTEEQARLVGEIAETIIPKTTTPGAKETGVPAFIDGMLKDVFSKKDQDRYLAGLAIFSDDAEKTLGKKFEDCESTPQLEFVKKYNDDAIKTISKERPFILMTKELTLIGFFTSQPGATEVLQYEQVPGPYQGCVPLTQVGKTWAT
jgi:gluconate 2-dehydrogenase gamma chain